MFPPLPPPNAQTIFVGTQQGPLPNQYSVETLVEQVRNGQLPSDAAIWYEGLANWVRLTDHPELRDRLNAPRGGGADPAPQQQVIAPATNETRPLAAAAAQLLSEWLEHQPQAQIRLLGVGAGDLTSNSQLDLFAVPESRRNQHLDATIDGIRAKFGSAALARASSLRLPRQ